MNETVSVAVIGLGAFGCQTLDSLRQCSLAEVVGIADRDAQTVERVGREANLPAYTDNRQLVLNHKPKVVFLSTPPMPSVELLESCAKMGIHVWKEAPMARNLGEAAAMARRFDRAGLKLAVGTQRRFADSYRRAFALKERLGETFLARAHYLFNWGPDLRWRADSQSAGGGALLELGYHFIDLIVAMMGLPEEAYGTTTCEKPTLADPSAPPHDTDDTAVATLRYKNRSMANIVTSRLSGPVCEELTLHGRNGSIVANSDSCVLRDSNGEVLDHLVQPAVAHQRFHRQVERFLQAVLCDEAVYPCSGWENVLTHAVIDAIYLSGRTAQPESPHQQLQIHGLTPEFCQRFCPEED